MDTLQCYQDIVKQVIQQYARFTPSHGNIRLDSVFDDARGHYALMQTGWTHQASSSQKKRVRGNLIYITLREQKVWIEYDGMEQSIIDELIAAGIPDDRIVLAFLPDAQAAVAV